VNKKPPELPNIEDATLRACLAPLMDAMTAGTDLTGPVASPDRPALPDRIPRVPRDVPPAPGSNDNPSPAGPAETFDQHHPGEPETRAEWRSRTDDDFALFRMIDLFLGMTDAELRAAARDFPNQIGGTVARIARAKRRLAAQYDSATTAIALLERALARAADTGTD